MLISIRKGLAEKIEFKPPCRYIKEIKRRRYVTFGVKRNLARTRFPLKPPDFTRLIQQSNGN